MHLRLLPVPSPAARGGRLLSIHRVVVVESSSESSVRWAMLHLLPNVQTDSGPVVGNPPVAGVTVFHGIPFAAPPVGDKRWGTTAPPTPWTKPVDATKPAAECPQLDVFRWEHLGNEDCLYLSVYVPDGCTAASPCPVMQWVHGGAWILGNNFANGSYDGTPLAQKGVVVVAANYRLDVLGWLALEELQQEAADGAFGNYGMHDQRFAFQWTQRNVLQFGGDPDQVTIFGESAGGFSVCQHLASPASNGLFSRAIVESGDCDGPWLLQAGADAKRFGDSVATAAGCPKDAADATSGARLACLRKLKVRQIMDPYVDSGW